MKQVFTDPRFPNFEVHNEGTNTFHVYERMPNGKLEEIDTFSTYSAHPQYRIAPEVVTKRARDYFERMASGKMNQELADREQDEPAAPDPLRSHPGAPEFKRVSLDDLMGGNVLSSDDVLDAYEKAKAITDPGQREQALSQVRQMTARLESAAQELVRRLLD